MFNLFNRPTSPEAEAKAYCKEWGKDPDEMVKGWNTIAYGKRVAVERPRWQWYLGVSEAALRKPI